MSNRNELLNTFLQSSFDGIFTYNQHLQITSYNQALSKLFELSGEDLKNKSISDVFPFLKKHLPSVYQCLKSGNTSISKTSYRKSETEDKIYLQVNISCIGSEMHQEGMVVLKDITDDCSKEKSLTKKRLKDALKAFDFSNDRLKCIINGTTDLIVAIDTHYHFILYNNRFKANFEKYTGKKVNLGVNVLDCLKHLPEAYQKTKENWQKILHGGEKEYHLIDKLEWEGSIVYVESIFNLIKDREGKVIGASQIIRDITERIQVEDLWITSEKRFSKMFHEARVGFALIDLKSKKFVQANPAFCEITGYQTQELTDLSPKDITNTKDYAKEAILMQQLTEGVKNSYKLEKRVQHQSQKQIWVSVSKTLLYDSDNQPEFGLELMENITDRKLTQKQLLESEAHNRALIDVFPDMIFKLDGQGNFLMSKTPGKPWEYHYVEDELVGKNLNDLPLPRKIKHRTLVMLQQALKDEKVAFYEGEIPYQNDWFYYEARFIKSGKNQVVMILRNITNRKKEESKIKDLLDTERSLNQNLEKQNEKLAVQEEKLAEANYQLRSQNESLANTTRELRKSREKLKETLKVLEERNFELDQFVYKTSHDLRSPLTSILGIVYLMKIEPDMTLFKDYAQKIEGRVIRLDDFIQSMLNYSRNSRSEVISEKINYQEILLQCLDDLKFYKNFDQIEKNWDIEGAETEFLSDSLRVKIILTNLISNAIKYQDFTKTNRYMQISLHISPQKTRISFHDNGIGIEKQYLENIYKMFYRATEISEGSGLGMYIVKQTVDKLRGSIRIESEGRGRGIRVTVEIPNRRKPTRIKLKN